METGIARRPELESLSQKNIPYPGSPVEIVAPAGTQAMVAAALQAGADSIYFGVENLNLRNQASGAFTLEDMQYVVRKCHRFKAKAYLTLNSVVYDRDMRLLDTVINEAKKSGVDAIIASDPAVIQKALEFGLTVHLSTQVSVSNLEAVRFWSRFADVIVLARELDLSMIRRIVDGIKEQDIRGPSGKPVKIEVFGHGALCIAVSGRCGMSLYSDLASANRGACRQNCRRKYKVIDERGVELEIDNEYIMSPNDICTLPFLNRVVESGISMLKIEGRNRGPDYVQNTVQVYRQALQLAASPGAEFKENIPRWMESLKQVYHRGFSSGYYLGERQGWAGSDGNQSSVRKVFVGQVRNYFSRISVAEIELRTGEIAQGQQLAFFGQTTGALRQEIQDIRVENSSVSRAKGPAIITVPVDGRVRKGDQVYRMDTHTEAST
ncbi:MAG TPA: collagenase-like protease [Leptospiraceae bacterium]|nr:collagenase-like protease [Spirochaetaceae bacterium]HBS04705.1 collagenase-like protease [Leptospiraceae bacterium]|tara:strand:+ start:18619 stop:19929 length:1311 start_codon:yes stop_codon:yes gene_type:complete